MNDTNEKHPSDERLMLEFAQGSADAFAELFRRYQQPIYAHKEKGGPEGLGPPENTVAR